MPIAAWIPYIVAALLAVSTGFAVMWLLRVATRSVVRLRTPSSPLTSPLIVLPLWMRLCTALIAAPAAYLGPLMPVGLRESLQERLRRAGLEDELTPPQFLLVGVTLGFVTIVPTRLLGAPWWLALLVAALAAAIPITWLLEVTARRRDEERQLGLAQDSKAHCLVLLALLLLMVALLG